MTRARRWWPPVRNQVWHRLRDTTCPCPAMGTCYRWPADHATQRLAAPRVPKAWRRRGKHMAMAGATRLRPNAWARDAMWQRCDAGVWPPAPTCTCVHLHAEPLKESDCG